MKKLMIAAVAVAMASVASAALQPAYRFTATLKTTKGKNMGTGYYNPYINLGRDAAGKMWYQADTVKQLITDQVVVRGEKYPMELVTDQRGLVAKLGKTGDGTPVIISLDADARKPYEDVLIALKDTFNSRSEGRYCATFRTYTEPECYRVVGTEKIDQTLYGDCCNVGFGNAAGASIPKSFLDDAEKPLIHVFGAATEAKCNKLEVFSSAVFPERDFQGYIAGQGAAKADKDTVGKTFIDATLLAGNIVGTMAAPVCIDCCTVIDALPDALAWDCVGTERKDTEVKVGEETFPTKKYDAKTTLARTAAFGNFRMKKVYVDVK